MKNIEIEVRSFISPVQYRNLGRKLNKVAKFLKEIKEETAYFRAKRENKVLRSEATNGSYCGKEDLRLRRDGNFSYLILKSGKIHDNFRDEIKIRFKRIDFEKLKDLFKRLGFNTDIIWFRKRKVYDWQGIKVFLDNTKGYGRIIELEKYGTKKDKEKIFNDLKAKLLSLGIEKITPKNEFEKKFKYYKNNWQKILKT